MLWRLSQNQGQKLGREWRWVSLGKPKEGSVTLKVLLSPQVYALFPLSGAGILIVITRHLKRSWPLIDEDPFNKPCTFLRSSKRTCETCASVTTWCWLEVNFMQALHLSAWWCLFCMPLCSSFVLTIRVYSFEGVYITPGRLGTQIHNIMLLSSRKLLHGRVTFQGSHSVPVAFTVPETRQKKISMVLFLASAVVEQHGQ